MRLFCITTIIVVLQWSGLLAPLNIAAGAESLDKNRNVLLLNSYNQKMSWVENIVQGVEDILHPEQNNLTLHIENMDTKVFFSAEYFESFRNYLQVKYQKTSFSLILLSDNNAYDFIRTHRKTLFPGVPVSFCGVNDFEQNQLAGLQDFTGVAELFSARQTVELALKIHPETTELFIINDYLKTGRAWAKDIDEDLQGLSDTIRIRHSGNLSIKELQDEISRLGPTALILLGVFFADRDGLYYTYERTGEILSKVSKVPVYCLLEFNIGSGIVGGHVISGYYQGKTMAEIGKKILSGEDADSIPVILQGSNRYVFDYKQLSRFGIDEKLLPGNSVIINRPFSFYQEYKTEVLTVLFFICALLLTIIGLILNIGRRKRAEKALQESEIRFRQLANATWEAIIVHSKGMFFHGNDPFYSLFGYQKGELDNKQILPIILPPESVGDVVKRIEQGILDPYETVAIRKNGEKFPVEIRVREMEYEERDVRMAAIRDLSGRKRIEQRLAQSQKLEAIGTLAGGIAHDFNNILSAIIGYCELASLEAIPGTKIKKYLGEMHKAGNRAKELVQQILTFARKSIDEKEPVQVSQVVVEALKLLRASLPTSISIQQHLNSNAQVLGETTKIHQVLMNLCTNAGKAMKDGGTLTVSLDEEYLDQEFISRNLGYTTGNHIKLSVKDTGVGIPPEDLTKIFDPFFTTRPKEEGTGLGLSVVHGIVRDCHGFITVWSEPGKGCDFSVYLPVADVVASHHTILADELPGGSERILLVDDETMLVNMMHDLLQKLGYEVTGFTSALEALHTFSKSPDDFDLVISDMTMPIMSGDTLAGELLSVRPDIPIILNTGFTDKITEDEALKIGIKRFIMKPVEINKLAPAIREVLAGE
ncbi:ATP-binding protein [Desulfopila sp. IMCC35008]|uniref:hybrid sensor histidine kinase/response regulator n=1 Tax=Desulfopila sp. IMCC35008 TaxID=2653858 RepID=UPI0013D6B25B|nr:ATP-binding protein [Desulfopila sp. IMCC35008]